MNSVNICMEMLQNMFAKSMFFDDFLMISHEKTMDFQSKNIGDFLLHFGRIIYFFEFIKSRMVFCIATA